MRGLPQMHKDDPAFAQGYKAKGKKDKKEETLDEKLTTSQIGTLKKTFDPLKGKKIGPNAQKKLMQIMDKLDRDKDTLGQLVKADIPFVSQLAVTRLISKHNMTGAQINKLKEETLDEKMKYTHAVVDNNGNVIGFTTNEKDAVFMSKNNLTKKKGAVVKLTKPMSQKQGDMKVGRKLFEEEILDEALQGFRVDFGKGMTKGSATYKNKKDAEEFICKKKKSWVNYQ